jgi:hypothetical protein
MWAPAGQQAMQIGRTDLNQQDFVNEGAGNPLAPQAFSLQQQVSPDVTAMMNYEMRILGLNGPRYNEYIKTFIAQKGLNPNDPYQIDSEIQRRKMRYLHYADAANPMGLQWDNISNPNGTVTPGLDSIVIQEASPIIPQVDLPGSFAGMDVDDTFVSSKMDWERPRGGRTRKSKKSKKTRKSKKSKKSKKSSRKTRKSRK